MKEHVCINCKVTFSLPIEVYDWFCCPHCQIPNSITEENLPFKSITLKKRFLSEVYKNRKILFDTAEYECKGGFRILCESGIHSFGWFKNTDGKSFWSYDGIGFLTVFNKKGDLPNLTLRGKEAGYLVKAPDFTFRIQNMIKINAFACFGSFPSFEALSDNGIMISGFSSDEEYVISFVSSTKSIFYLKGKIIYKDESGKFITS
jgi:hypothetical protein